MEKSKMSHRLVLKSKLTHKNFYLGAVSAVFRYALMVGISFIILYPILVKLSNSVKSNQDLFDRSVFYIPKQVSLEFYTWVIDAVHLDTGFIYSLVLALLVSFLQVFFASFIGYGFARFKFRGKKVLFIMVIVSLLIPPQTIMTAQFLQFRFFDIFGLFSAIFGEPINLINTLWPYALLSITGFGLKNGLYIYLMAQFYQGIPQELEEAGHVDGAGPFRIYFKIMMPNAFLMMVVVFVFSFSWQWTDSYYPRFFIPDWITMPTGAMSIPSVSNGTLHPFIYKTMQDAATILIILPLAAVYSFTQKLFMEGIEKSGITG